MERYGIIETSSTFIPGDERSQTHPGHGYPAYTVHHEEITEFKTREEWEKWINEAVNPKFGSPKEFRAIIFREVELKISFNINID